MTKLLFVARIQDVPGKIEITNGVLGYQYLEIDGELDDILDELPEEGGRFLEKFVAVEVYTGDFEKLEFIKNSEGDGYEEN